MALKRRRKAKPGSRIPGVPVGDEVETTIGMKKKVCFNVGGKWFFRMVDPEPVHVIINRFVLLYR